MDDKFTSKNVASRPDVAFSRTFTRPSRSTANFWKRSISDNVTSLAAAANGGKPRSSFRDDMRMVPGFVLFYLMLWTFMEYIGRMIYIYICVYIYIYICIYIYGWWFQPL